MLIALSKFNSLPIASLAEESKIGSVEEAVLNPDTGELVGFWVRATGGIFGSRKALSARDIVSYEPTSLVVKDNGSIVDAAEIRPFISITSRGESWLGRRVQDESGKTLGRVKEVIVETDLDAVAKLYIGTLFGPERVIDRNQIVKIKKDAIIVRNDTSTVAGETTTIAQEAV